VACAIPSSPRPLTERVAASTLAARRFTVRGRVQGVGFRPFVLRLAGRHGLAGWVQNRSGEVEILAQGVPAALDAFARELIDQAPPLARPAIASIEPRVPSALDGFSVVPSTASAESDVHVPPDQFACDDCLAELDDPANRRYRYPFVNCTQCGPRYTLIRRLPYDRHNTTMAGFALCPACRREYQDPADRRFHAEPLACPACGPRLRFHGPDAVVDGNEPALAAAVAALRAGGILAVKGIGGYHLMCDAADNDAVARLRARKPRPHKPLAVMFPRDRELIARHLRLDALHERLLHDPARPIVLVPRAPGSNLSPDIAPGIAEIGAMLAYSPLHHLLLAELGRPLIATSANVSGEPVLTAEAAVERRLGHVAQSFLHHDRPIERPADDPVQRVVAGKARWIRLGRGCAPLELDLPFAVARPTLAVGSHMKNTIALAWGRRVVVSPHIGDLESPRSLETFEQCVRDLQALYGVRAERVACDAHPGYAGTRWALRSGLESMKIWHHHAHASAIAGERPAPARWLVFAWDGVGLGEDGDLWGGDALFGAPGRWRRVARMRPFRLPGGDQAAREPWRSAASLCWEEGVDWHALPANAGLAREAWTRGLNAPRTTAVGRLFDAAAAFLGLNLRSTFEGQGPMLLEAAAGRGGRLPPVALPLAARAGLLECDWAPLVPAMLDARQGVAERAALWHESIALALVSQALAVRERETFDCVGLAGGVFQNRLLAERALALLHASGLQAHLPERLPCNDAALSFGQVVESSCRA
jgi:hydrogenase maturation protein HypF